MRNRQRCNQNRYDRILLAVDEAIDLSITRRIRALNDIKASKDWEKLPIYLKGKVDQWIEVRMRNKDRAEGHEVGARLP